MDPRREASDRVNGEFEVRVLEPSPPAVTDPPWFADDPTARDTVPSGRRLLSPVTTGDLTWHELCTRDPELSSFCAQRWLGAYPRLAELPHDYGITRSALHTLAEHAIAPARYAWTGKIGLRYTRAGFGTPFFRAADGDRQVRVEGTDLVLQIGAEETRSPITTVGDCARMLDVEPGCPTEVYEPETELDPSRHLEVSVEAAARLSDWFGFAASVLEQLRAETEAEEDPARVQLWPEHFDMAVEIGRDEGRGTFGASPGDASHPDPYLYVTPWTPQPDVDIWNARHFEGAHLPYEDLLGAPDQRATALEFFRKIRAHLR